MRNELVEDAGIIKSNDKKEFKFKADKDLNYHCFSIDSHQLYRLVTSISPYNPTKLEISFMKTNKQEQDVFIKPGPFTLKVKNLMEKPTCVILVATDDESVYDRVLQKNPITIKPFLSGKMLLNHYLFRKLYKIQRLPQDLNLKVGNVTILFTDMTGSTDLYERTGDLVAYDIVQKHFHILETSIHNNQGVIIKTIGDAVMASFSNDTDAVQASIEIHDKIAELNAEIPEHEISLKIGIHTGNALAVTANEQLDYFGRTINIAARIQQKARAWETLLTAAISQNPQIQEKFEEEGYSFKQSHVKLRGIEGRYKIRRYFKEPQA